MEKSMWIAVVLGLMVFGCGGGPGPASSPLSSDHPDVEVLGHWVGTADFSFENGPKVQIELLVTMQGAQDPKNYYISQINGSCKIGEVTYNGLSGTVDPNAGAPNQPPLSISTLMVDCGAYGSSEGNGFEADAMLNHDDPNPMRLTLYPGMGMYHDPATGEMGAYYGFKGTQIALQKVG